MNRRNFIVSVGGLSLIYGVSQESTPVIASTVSFRERNIDLHEDANINELSLLLDFDSFNINANYLNSHNSIDIEIKSGINDMETVSEEPNITIPKNGKKDISSSINSVNVINTELKDVLRDINEGDTVNFDICILIHNSKVDTVEIRESFTISVIEPRKQATIHSSEKDTMIDNEISFSAEDSETNNEDVSYTWDFDDGTIKEGEKVKHSYSEQGEYNVQLTMTDEIGEEYTDNINITISIPSNLVGYWRFNDSGDKLIDYSGNENHGDIYGGITQEVDGHKDGELAYRYDGSSGYVTVPDVDGYNGDKLTFTAWVNIETNDTSSIMDMHDYQDLGDDGSGKIHIEQNDSGYFRVTLKDDNSNNVINMRDGPQLSQNQWKFIVVRYDGSNAEVSYDGDIKDTDSGSGDVASLEDFQFGMHKEGRWFDGRISEIRIYNEFLTDEQLEDVREGENIV